MKEGFTMFCRKCGAPLLPDDEFCSKCGAKVLKDDNAAAPSQAQSTPQKSQFSSASNNSNTPSAETAIYAEVEVMKPSIARYVIGGFLVLFGICSIHDVITDPGKEFHVGLALTAFFLSILFVAGGLALIYTRKILHADKKGYDTAIANHRDPMPFMDVKKIALRHPITGIIKRVSTNYSWGTFFFNCLCPLFRGDVKWFAIMAIITMPLSLISAGILGLLAGPIFAVFYNKKYIRGLIEKGYQPADTISMEWLRNNSLLIKYPR
ncbi:zinc-ribbon domain-containing protein [Mitsuokella jalaludinii]|uniref:zinc-ribbon domain-containing protein n=1 Tax=Mitsuokella jalaludinii TaxID=187979 RepID=UPI003F9A8648